jgi:hypothetical protein
VHTFPQQTNLGAVPIDTSIRFSTGFPEPYTVTRGHDFEIEDKYINLSIGISPDFFSFIRSAERLSG